MAYLLFFALTAFALLFISLPFFKKLDEPPTRHRINSIDGLRGILAFAVVVNHFDSTLYTVKFSKWGTYHVFDGLLGEVAVSIFFMITGYLFWGKLLASNGKTNWRVLFVNRFFRIAPVYYAVLIPVLLIVIFSTGAHANVAPSSLFFSVFKWLFVGMQSMTDINGFQMMRVLGVIWTLRYEWIFYFSLIVTSYFIRKNIPLSFCIAGLVFGLIHLQYGHPEKAAIPLFFCGMLCATFKKMSINVKSSAHLNSFIASLAVVLVFVFFNTATGVVQVLLLFIFFFFITNTDTQLFGLLSLTGAKRISHISYSLYLAHLSILYVFFNTPAVRNFSKQGDGQFWSLTFVCTVIVIIVSSLCYYFIEKGGVIAGKKFVKKYIE
jgi:peptidoglycan/LPS O-acetylase OafA/YrhL